MAPQSQNISFIEMELMMRKDVFIIIKYYNKCTIFILSLFGKHFNCVDINL